VSALILLIAFIAGLISRRIGYPPLLGYLAAGFGCAALHIGDVSLLEPFAAFGITMLLFTIGLKLRLPVLAKPLLLSTLVV